MTDANPFQDDKGWLPPTMSGGSAGLNSTMFFACSRCGAVVLDMHHSTVNRQRHHEWHTRLREVMDAVADALEALSTHTHTED